MKKIQTIRLDLFRNPASSTVTAIFNDEAFVRLVVECKGTEEWDEDKLPKNVVKLNNGIIRPFDDINNNYAFSNVYAVITDDISKEKFYKSYGSKISFFFKVFDYDFGLETIEIKNHLAYLRNGSTRPVTN